MCCSWEISRKYREKWEGCLTVDMIPVFQWRRELMEKCLLWNSALQSWLVNTGNTAAEGSVNIIRQLRDELLLSAQAGCRLIGRKRFLAFFIPNSETFPSTQTAGAPSCTTACKPLIRKTAQSISSPPNKLPVGEILSLAPEHTRR